MPAKPFIDIEQLLPSAPLPAISALLQCAAIFLISRKAVGCLIRKESPAYLDRAAGFVVVVALVSALVHGMALLGLSSIQNLRILGAVIFVASVVPWPHQKTPSLFTQAAFRWQAFKQLRLRHKIALTASLLTVLALAGASLAPPTDIDSLAYHMSLPMNWLNHDGAYATPFWLHSRLVGIGESINLLGIAMGTDCLGSLLQASGLFLLLAAFASLANSRADVALGFLLVASCPLWSYMALTTKPQLLPAAANTLALALLWKRSNTNSTSSWWPHVLLMFFCLMYAAACKYSFVPSAAVLSLLITWKTYQREGIRSLPSILTIGLCGFAALVLPVWLRNFSFYGDRFSPILEVFRGEPAPAVTSFSSYLRDFSGEHSWHNLIRLPIKLVIPTGIGRFSMVLGAGALAWLVALDRDRFRQVVLVSATIVVIISVCFGQLSARFFVEPYLWCGLAAVSSGWTIRKRILTVLLGCQVTASFAVALFAACTLFPGVLNTDLRNTVLRKHAADYVAAKYLDQLLPEDAVVASDRRALFYSKRQTIPNDFVLFTLRSNLNEAEKKQRITSYLRSMRVNTLVITEPLAESPYAWLITDQDERLAVSEPFQDAVRNPWRKGQTYQLSTFNLRDHPLLKTSIDGKQTSPFDSSTEA